MMCEGYLGIKPHFELWRYFFSISLIKKKERGQETLVTMGCMGIHLRGQRADEYMPCQLSRSNKGWHSHWFYLKNDPTTSLPVFSERLVEMVPPSWSWGATHQGEEEDARPPRGHRIPEDPRPP